MKSEKMFVAACVATLATLGGTQSAMAGVFTDWVAPGVVTSSSLHPVSDYIPGSSAEYMWYCDPSAATCDATSGATAVQFQMSFSLPADTGYRLYRYGSISIVAVRPCWPGEGVCAAASSRRFACCSCSSTTAAPPLRTFTMPLISPVR